MQGVERPSIGLAERDVGAGRTVAGNAECERANVA